MARKTTIMHQLEHSLTALDMNPATVIEDTRRLLGAYGKLAWIATDHTTPLAALPELRAGLDLIHTLTSNPIPSIAPMGHGVAIVCDIMQQILQQIRAYPTNGEQYHTILQHAYFDNDPQTDAVLMETLHLERTTYYSRKREAVTLFGYLIYSKYLPQLHQALR